MVILVVNGFAHRVTNAGTLQSAPIRKFGLPNEEKEVIVPNKGWESRTPESMNLTGGDHNLIESELQRISYIFSEDYTLPSSEPLVQQKVEADAPR